MIKSTNSKWGKREETVTKRVKELIYCCMRKILELLNYQQTMFYVCQQIFTILPKKHGVFTSVEQIYKEEANIDHKKLICFMSHLKW